jgi:hypothetical protein
VDKRRFRPKYGVAILAKLLTTLMVAALFASDGALPFDLILVYTQPVACVRPEMAFLVLICVLRGFRAAAYRCTPHRKPLCGLDQNQKFSFLTGTRSYH